MLDLLLLVGSGRAPVVGKDRNRGVFAVKGQCRWRWCRAPEYEPSATRACGLTIVARGGLHDRFVGPGSAFEDGNWQILGRPADSQSSTVTEMAGSRRHSCGWRTGVCELDFNVCSRSLHKRPRALAIRRGHGRARDSVSAGFVLAGAHRREVQRVEPYCAPGA